MEDKMKKTRRKKSIETYRSRWEEKPKVLWGIPMTASYQDGQTKKTCKGRSHDVDRYGNPLTLKEKNSLMWYREEQRKLWLKEKDSD